MKIPKRITKERRLDKSPFSASSNRLLERENRAIVNVFEVWLTFAVQPIINLNFKIKVTKLSS